MDGVHAPIISAIADASSNRYQGRASFSAFADIAAMDTAFDFNAMRDRLRAGLEAKGLSMRSVSLKSGNAAGYVQGIIKDGKEPTITNLAAVCDAAGLSLTYVLYGLTVSPETEDLMRKLEDNPEKRDSIIALLRS